MLYTVREANVNDIDAMLEIRKMVKENILSNPDSITHKDCETFVTQRGKAWVAEANQTLLGFAIIDLKDDNVWALFIHPEYEKRGIGKKLHQAMLSWYFDQGKNELWLSTEPHTRAEGFYLAQNWIRAGLLPNGEVKFEMTLDHWKNSKLL